MSDFKVGDRVCLVEGNAYGMCGEIVEITSTGRIEVQTPTFRISTLPDWVERYIPVGDEALLMEAVAALELINHRGNTDDELLQVGMTLTRIKERLTA